MKARRLVFHHRSLFFPEPSCIFFFFFKCFSESFDSQNLVYELPAEGGTNPYPLAPTMTPLESAELGGGPGGNNTGPTEKNHMRKH